MIRHQIKHDLLPRNFIHGNQYLVFELIDHGQEIIEDKINLNVTVSYQLYTGYHPSLYHFYPQFIYENMPKESRKQIRDSLTITVNVRITKPNTTGEKQ